MRHWGRLSAPCVYDTSRQTLSSCLSRGLKADAQLLWDYGHLERLSALLYILSCSHLGSFSISPVFLSLKGVRKGGLWNWHLYLPHLRCWGGSSGDFLDTIPFKKNPRAKIPGNFWSITAHLQTHYPISFDKSFTYQQIHSTFFIPWFPSSDGLLHQMDISSPLRNTLPPLW